MSTELEVVESDQESESGIDGQQSVTDYAASVLGREIESLRRISDGLDLAFGARKVMKFKDRLAYLAARERLAGKIVEFTEKLCRLTATNPNPELDLSDGATSWDPDAPREKSPQAR